MAMSFVGGWVMDAAHAFRHGRDRVAPVGLEVVRCSLHVECKTSMQEVHECRSSAVAVSTRSDTRWEGWTSTLSGYQHDQTPGSTCWRIMLISVDELALSPLGFTSEHRVRLSDSDTDTRAKHSSVLIRSHQITQRTLQSAPQHYTGRYGKPHRTTPHTSAALTPHHDTVKRV